MRARALGALTAGAGALPPPLVRGGLTALATLFRYTRYERRTLANLALAYGDELDAAARAHIARGVRRHTARLVAEWLRLARGAPLGGPHAARGRWIDEAVELDDSLQVLEDQVARGRGALVVTAHIGNWELLCAALRRRGFTGAVVGRERRRDPSAAWFRALREGYGVHTIPQHAPPREVLRVLQAGGVVGLLADLEVRRLAGEPLPLFGRPALTMLAPAALARARRLPLVPCRCVVTADGRYRLSFEEPLALDEALERAEGTRELMARLNAVYERWIRASPEQWAWHQSRWRAGAGD